MSSEEETTSLCKKLGKDGETFEPGYIPWSAPCPSLLFLDEKSSCPAIRVPCEWGLSTRFPSIQGELLLNTSAIAPGFSFVLLGFNKREGRRCFRPSQFFLSFFPPDKDEVDT